MFNFFSFYKAEFPLYSFLYGFNIHFHMVYEQLGTSTTSSQNSVSFLTVLTAKILISATQTFTRTI